MRAIMLLILLTACTTTDLSFAPNHAGLPQTGQWKTTLAIGDINNDGRPDLAAIGRKYNATAKTWLNTPTRWNEAITGIDQRSQCGIDVAFADINTDGNLDVAFAQHCGGPAVYLGNGNGEWTPFSNGLPSTGSNALALDDFDNDGHIDLITMSAEATDGFHLYELHNTTWHEQRTNLPTTLTATPFQLTSIDLNNDNKPDLLTGTHNATIYYNTGNHQFTPQTIGTGYYLATADIDNDGLRDYALSAPRLVLHYGNGSRNDFGPCKGAVTIADMNNDAAPDLIANCNTIRILLNPDWTAHTLPGNGHPYGIHATDLNNDGRTDLVSAHDGGILSYIQQ